MVTTHTEHEDHEVNCTFDPSTGTLELCVACDAEPEDRDIFAVVPLGPATIEQAKGAVVLRASGSHEAVHSGGEPLVSIEISVPGDLDGNGVVDVEDAMLATTMEEVRAIAANAGRKGSPGGVASSIAVDKGKLQATSQTSGVWALVPEPLVVIEAGSFEHVQVTASIHVPAGTEVELMLVVQLAGGA